MGCVVSDQLTKTETKFSPTNVIEFNIQKNLVGSYGDHVDARHIYMMVRPNGEEFGHAFHVIPGDIFWCLCEEIIFWHDGLRCPIHNS
jgi:hypothetical protein